MVTSNGASRSSLVSFICLFVCLFSFFFFGVGGLERGKIGVWVGARASVSHATSTDPRLDSSRFRFFFLLFVFIKKLSIKNWAPGALEKKMVPG